MDQNMNVGDAFASSTTPENERCYTTSNKNISSFYLFFIK